MQNDMRDRLVDLLKNSPHLDTLYCEFEDAADWLIAKGVIVPPCKAGDTVYYINTRPHIVLRRNEIYEAKVVRIVATSLGVALVIHTRGEYGCCETPDIRDWNETVFLTKDQAEQKLKELSEND